MKTVQEQGQQICGQVKSQLEAELPVGAEMHSSCWTDSYGVSDLIFQL